VTVIASGARARQPARGPASGASARASAKTPRVALIRASARAACRARFAPLQVVALVMLFLAAAPGRSRPSRSGLEVDLERHQRVGPLLDRADQPAISCLCISSLRVRSGSWLWMLPCS